MLARLSTLALLLGAGCVTPPTKPVQSSTPASTEADGPSWQPGAGADVALAALIKSQPFALPATELARASGGKVPRRTQVEPLLFELHVRYDDKGRATNTSHVVYRILLDDADLKTQEVPWAAWHQKRPVIKTRVISPDGAEKWLDEKTIVETSAIESAEMLSDAKMLRAPLPGAVLGSVVESVVVTQDAEPSFPAAASGSFDTWQYQRRHTRLVIEHPTSLPLTATVVGGGTLQEATANGVRTLTLDMTPPEFNQFKLAELDVMRQLPRVEWSTARSWQPVAQGYAAWVNEVKGPALDTSELQRTLKASDTRAQKVQAALAWVRGKARYSALHLGAGALKPTPPQTVLSRGYGDCKDLALTLVSTLEPLGITAHVALIQSQGTPTPENAPGLAGFDHAIVYVPADKGEAAFWVDATAEGFPVGTLPETLLDRKALVIAKDTQGLTALPTRNATVTRIEEEFVVNQTDFGPSKATITRRFLGPIAGWVRRRLTNADAKELEAFARPSTRALMGDDPIKVKLENGAPSLLPPTLVTTDDQVSAVDTSAVGVTVALLGPDLATWLDEDLLGRDGERREADAEREEERAQEILEATGLTEAQLDKRPVKLQTRVVLDRRVRVVPANGFVSGALPPARTVTFGPSTWTEAFTRATDGSVEAHYQFDSGAVDFEGDALASFRTAYWKFQKENWPSITLSLAADELFNEAKPLEAMAAWKSALDANPKQGVLRARYAGALADFGLPELAKPQLEQALKDSPHHPLVLMIEGDIARRGKGGLPFAEGFDRAHAIKAMRAAIKELPTHTWPRLRLAELLEHNDKGELIWTKTPDLEEAVTLYEKLADEGVDAALTPLFDLQLRLGRFADTLARKAKLRQRPADDIYGLAASLTLEGPALCVQHLREIKDPKQRAVSAASILGVVGLSRDYALVDKAAAAFEPEFPGGGGTILRGLFSGVKASPPLKDASSPEAAMKRALSRMGVTPASVRDEQLSAFCTANGKAELAKYGVRWGFTSQFQVDAMLTRGTCKVDGDTQLARVKCTLDMGRPVVGTGYFVKEGAEWKLESFGSLPTLTTNAWAKANAKDVEAASRWLSWTAERVDQLNLPASYPDLQLFKSTWPPAGTPTADEVKFAAAQARFFGPLDDSAIPELAAVIDQQSRALTGGRRRLADQVLSDAYLRINQHKKALDLLEPLAKSEGEDQLFRKLAYAYARAGEFPKAKALVEKGLARAPADAAWTAAAAFVSERGGDYADALHRYEAIYERTHDQDLLNNLVWLRFMVGTFDQETEKLANLLVASESPSVQHTAAAVLIERGKVKVGAELARRIVGQVSRDGMAESLQQLKAQLLQALGFTAEARAAWSGIVTKDPKSDLARLKERGLKALEKKK